MRVYISEEYPYVIAWHCLSWSYTNYINAQIEKAINDKAPERAIYRREDGTWCTIDEVRNEVLKNEIEKYVREHLS